MKHCDIYFALVDMSTLLFYKISQIDFQTSGIKVYSCVHRTAVRAEISMDSDKVGELLRGQHLIAIKEAKSDGTRPDRICFDCVWSDGGPNLSLKGWVSTTRASDGSKLLQELDSSEALVWQESSLAVLRSIMKEQGLSSRNLSATQMSAATAAAKWKAEVKATEIKKVSFRQHARAKGILAGGRTDGSSNSMPVPEGVPPTQSTSQLLSLNEVYEQINYGLLAESVSASALGRTEISESRHSDAIVNQLTQTLMKMEQLRRKVVGGGTASSVHQV